MLWKRTYNVGRTFWLGLVDVLTTIGVLLLIVVLVVWIFCLIVLSFDSSKSSRVQ